MHNEQVQASLANNLKATTAKIKTEAQNKAKAETFFEKARKRFAAKDGPTPQQEYEQAKNLGQKKATAFMDAVHDATHPDHDKNLKLYQDWYDCNPQNVKNHMIAEASKDLGAPDPEDMKQNPNYEAFIANRYKPGAVPQTRTKNGLKREKQNPPTKDYKAFYDILMSQLEESRARVGYGPAKQADRDIIDAWRAKYAPDAPEWAESATIPLT